MRWRSYRQPLAVPIHVLNVSAAYLYLLSENHAEMSNFSQYRKHIRLTHYDYQADGYYFVTICTHNRQPRFANEAVKTLVLEKVHQFPLFSPGIVVDQVVVMDDHLHIIFAFESSRKSLGQVVQILKSWVTRGLKGPKPVWQSNYYEHVIRNESALKKIREYIKNNPLTEQIKFEQFYE